MRSRRGGQPNGGSRSQAANRRAARLLSALARAMPSAKVELAYGTPLELLIATILSAQCTDERVNQVTPALFKRYRRAADYAEADLAELEALIRSTGFFKSKARNIVACGRMLTERFGGKVPDTMEQLVMLPGVGRKTANVILGSYFGQPAIVVDTHVKRAANRLGLAASEEPERIELALQRLIPRDQRTSGSQRLLLHGRYVCMARKPECARCVLYSECPWEGKRPR